MGRLKLWRFVWHAGLSAHHGRTVRLLFAVGSLVSALEPAGNATPSRVSEKRIRRELAAEREQALPIDVVSRGLAGMGRLTLMPVVIA